MLVRLCVKGEEGGLHIVRVDGNEQGMRPSAVDPRALRACLPMWVGDEGTGFGLNVICVSGLGGNMESKLPRIRER